MTVEGDVWLALNDLRAGHRDEGCPRAGCAIASLSDHDLEELLHAVSPDGSARMTEVAEIALMRPAIPVAVADSGGSSPDGARSDGPRRARRFKVGDRVVYDSQSEINQELGGDYQRLGVCTVTALDGEDSGQLLSFVDERGDLHDGWWADRFKTAAEEATAEEREDDVTYFVAFQSATGYGYRVLAPRPRIVTAADVMAMTDLLATDVGGGVVPLNWIELPPPGPSTASVRPPGSDSSGPPPEIRSTPAPIRIDRGHSVRNGSAPTAGAPQTQPARAAGPSDHPEVPYLPRRAM
jgi:hypothetical protein